MYSTLIVTTMSQVKDSKECFTTLGQTEEHLLQKTVQLKYLNTHRVEGFN